MIQHDTQNDFLNSFRNNPFVFSLIGIGLIASIVLFFEVFRIIKFSRYEASPNNLIAARNVEEPQENITNTRDIRRANFFGRMEAPSIDQLSDSQLPQTSLQLSLRGVFTASRQRNASAIVENKDGVSRNYKVGQYLDDDTSLRAVYPDRILLSRAGRLESLYFPTTYNDSSENNADVAAAEYAKNSQTTGNNSDEELIRNSNLSALMNSSALSEQQKQTLVKKRLEALRKRARVQNSSNTEG